MHELPKIYHPSKGYFKRLPQSIRDPFSNEIELYEGKDALQCGWGAIWSPELCVFTFDDVRDMWSGRREVIERGGLRLVKELYKHLAELNIIEEIEYDYDDLTWAIRCGHKNIFWYLFDLFPARKDSDINIILYQGIFAPMVEMGHIDWLIEYNTRYPGDIKAMTFDAREEVMVMALRLQDAGMICELVKAGLHITDLTISAAYVTIRRQVARIHGRRATAIEEVECRKMEDTLYPIIIHLQELYPSQIDTIAASLLLPHVPEIDDEPYESGDEDESEDDEQGENR